MHFPFSIPVSITLGITLLDDDYSSLNIRILLLLFYGPCGFPYIRGETHS